MYSSWYGNLIFWSIDRRLTIAELRHKRRITVAAASKILANLTYSYKSMGLGMGTMLAGVRLPHHKARSKKN